MPCNPLSTTWTQKRAGSSNAILAVLVTSVFIVAPIHIVRRRLSTYLSNMTGVKMITCCFCGAREMMSMGKGQRRSLSCQSCGAPVHKVEMVHRNEPAPAPKQAPAKKHTGKYQPPKHKDAYRKKRGKRKKGFFEKLWDDVDDIFDVDDWFD